MGNINITNQTGQAQTFSMIQEMMEEAMAIHDQALKKDPKQYSESRIWLPKNHYPPPKVQGKIQKPHFIKFKEPSKPKAVILNPL